MKQRAGHPREYQRAYWSDARANKLLALRAEGLEWKEILQAINQLPGTQVRTVEAVWQKYDRLCRQKGIKKDDRKKWTVERIEKLLALKMADVPYADILLVLSALPGLPIGTVESVKRKFLKLHGERKTVSAMFKNPQVIPADTAPRDGVVVSSLNSPPGQSAPAAAFSGGRAIVVPYEVVRQWAVREGLCGRKNAPNLHVINQYRQQQGKPALMIAGAL